MLEILSAARVLAVKVAVAIQQFPSTHFPGTVVLLPLLPPLHARPEFVELKRHGFRVVLPTFGKRVLVIPDIPGRPRAVEENHIGGDAGIRCEYAVRQAENGVEEVELLEQLFLDAGANTVAAGPKEVLITPCWISRIRDSK
jgi:hypothetical protein